MIREDAIKELTELLPEEFLMEYTDAIKMGIEALEQQPCEDCISRESVSGCVSTMYYKGLGKQKSLEYILKYVERLPSVSPQPQPKMGHWEWNQYDANPKIGNFHCSLCHCIGRSYFDYCPACGAKMSEIPTVAEGSEE